MKIFLKTNKKKFEVQDASEDAKNIKELDEGQIETEGEKMNVFSNFDNDESSQVSFLKELQEPDGKRQNTFSLEFNSKVCGHALSLRDQVVENALNNKLETAITLCKKLHKIMEYNDEHTNAIITKQKIQELQKKFTEAKKNEIYLNKKGLSKESIKTKYLPNLKKFILAGVLVAFLSISFLLQNYEKSLDDKFLNNENLNKKLNLKSKIQQMAQKNLTSSVLLDNSSSSKNEYFHPTFKKKVKKINLIKNTSTDAISNRKNNLERSFLWLIDFYDKNTICITSLCAQNVLNLKDQFILYAFSILICTHIAIVFSFYNFIKIIHRISSVNYLFKNIFRQKSTSNQAKTRRQIIQQSLSKTDDKEFKGNSMSNKSDFFWEFKSSVIPERLIFLRDLIVEYASKFRYEVAIILCKKLKKDLETTESTEFKADLIAIDNKIQELKQKYFDYQYKIHKLCETNLSGKKLFKKCLVKLVEDQKEFAFDQLIHYINNQAFKLKNLLRKADFYDSRGNFAKVEEYELKVLKSVESDIYCPDLLKAKLKARLFLTYINQGKIEEAKKLFFLIKDANSN